MNETSMIESPILKEILQLRERLVHQVSEKIQFPEPSMHLNLESRKGSEVRCFKHIHQSCIGHTWNFSAASKVKHLYLLDAYIDMAKAKNPLGIYMVARSTLEFSAFLHEVSTRLLEASVLAQQKWLDGGCKFFGIIVRARFATSDAEHKKLLSKEQVPADLLKPMNVKNCMQNLVKVPGLDNVIERYDKLCDFVHHNLGSASVANSGSAVADAACSSRGGMIFMKQAGPITQYEYPIPSKGQHALDDTSSSFLNDARQCVDWITMIPESPYSAEQIQHFTGSEFGMISLERIVQPGLKTPARIQRNDLCPCGSGKKYKKCCLN